MTQSTLTSNKTISILFCILLVIGSPSARAGVWFVDNAIPSTGNGQSWSTAFKRFSDISWSSIRPGDIIFVSGGPSGGTKTYSESWSIGASGMAGSPITITVDNMNSTHNGIVIFDYDYLGDQATNDGIILSNRGYITFNGNVNGQSHLVIKNLRNIINRTNATCLSGYGSTSIVIDHVDFINCNNGVRLWSGATGTGTEIKNSNFKQIRGDVAILLSMSGATFDNHKVHDNYIELLANGAVPVGGTGPYVGPDGLQPGNGVSFYHNIVKVQRTTLYTSSQHIDDIQYGMARYLKIYDNEFINVGDSVIDLGAWGTNISLNDIWIYNNVFRIETAIDPYPEYIRLYANPGNISSINNLKIFNNLFLDGATDYPVINFGLAPGYGGDPTGTGIEFVNNIFYNTAGINIAPSAGFNSNSFKFSTNLYFPATTPIKFTGTSYTASAWITTKEVTGKAAEPLFQFYAKNSPDNNLHLAPTDKAAVNGGTALNSYFSTDKDGISRPQGLTWDIGPYEFVDTPAPLVFSAPQNLRVEP